MQRVGRYTDEQEQEHLSELEESIAGQNLQNLADTIVPKNMTKEEYQGYVAGLTTALDMARGASTFQSAKENISTLLAIAIRRKNKLND